MSIAGVCRGRCGDIAATVVDFIFALIFVIVFFVAPHRWGCDVLPLTGHGYWLYDLICCRGHHPWCRCPASGDKEGSSMAMATINET
jgi:hypothetical protein